MILEEDELAITLKKYYESVSQVYAVKKMILFGSYAKGTTRKDSDIDVGVVIERIPGKSRIEIMTNLFSLVRNINVDIEPYLIYWDEYLNPPHASILSEIISTSKEIEA